MDGGLIMSRCDYCHVEIDENLNICPLCFKHIRSRSEIKNPEYPKYKRSDNTILSFGLKTLLFVFISIVLVSLIVNLFLWNGIPWFLFIISSLFYIWILIKSTIIGRAHYGTKILIQLFGLSVLITVIDSVNGTLSWSVNYVIPLIIIISNLLITIKIARRRIKWRNYSVFLIILILLGFIPILFFNLNIITILWPSAAAGLYTLLTFIGFLTFSYKRFSRELFKVFHL